MRRLFVFLMALIGFVPTAHLQHAEDHGRQLVKIIEAFERQRADFYKTLARLRGENVALRKSYRGLVEQYESLRASFQDKLRQARRERLMRAVEVPEPPDQLLDKIKRDIPPLAVAVLALVLIFLAAAPAAACDDDSCSGEFRSGVVVVSDAICPNGGWCWKEEFWGWDECGNLVAHSCRSGSDCGDCGLTCEEPDEPQEPAPDPDPYPDYQQPL